VKFHWRQAALKVQEAGRPAMGGLIAYQEASFGLSERGFWFSESSVEGERAA